MAIEIKAPGNYAPCLRVNYTLFLGGSIEMGAAEPWQQQVVDALSEHKRLLILNPRRSDWDNTWKQSLADANFVEQVEWELDAMEAADKVILYFDPKTKSPISLLELGLWVGRHRGKVIACCPDGFYRKGNVQVTCRKYGALLVDTFDELLNYLQTLP
jgi:nucleoside 2-deoxyribosyltransferase-like protein